MKKSKSTAAMGASALSEPDASLVAGLLKEVDYENRLEACLMRERSGPAAVTIYSFKEAVRLLSDPFPLVDPVELVSWVREAVGDRELSEKIAGAVGAETCMMNKIRAAANLMAQRMEQVEKGIGD